MLYKQKAIGAICYPNRRAQQKRHECIACAALPSLFIGTMTKFDYAVCLLWMAWSAPNDNYSRFMCFQWKYMFVHAYVWPNVYV